MNGIGVKFEKFTVEDVMQMWEALACIVLNARVGPDPFMGGACDAYIVPLADVLEALAVISKLRAKY